MKDKICFATATTTKTLKEQRKEIIEIALQYQEQIQGGGNGRRIFTQFIDRIK